MGSDCLYREKGFLVVVALVVVGILAGCNSNVDEGIATGDKPSMNSTTSNSTTNKTNTTNSTLRGPVEIPPSHRKDMAAHIANSKANAELFYPQATLAIKDSIFKLTNGAIAPGRRLNAATAAEIISGISTFGEQLFLGVEKLLPDDATSHEYFSQFKEAWLDLFRNLGAESATIVKGVEEYIDEAKPEKLVAVINECIVLATKVVEAFLPQEIYAQIEKYLEGVGKMFQGFSTGWNLLADGDNGEGVVAIYDGVRAGLELVLPASVTQDETYVEVAGFLDNVVADLTDNIAMFTKRLTENKACWREKKDRENQRPNICTFQGYVWDQAWQCIKPSTDPLPAICDTSSDYTYLIGENQNRLCYKDCDAGFEPRGVTDETQCVTTCSGERSVPGKYGITSQWNDMCGTNQQAMLDISARITTRALNLAFSTVEGIVNMVQQKRFIGSSLSKIIQSALDFAAEFVFPTCEASGTVEPRRLLALPPRDGV